MGELLYIYMYRLKRVALTFLSAGNCENVLIGVQGRGLGGGGGAEWGEGGVYNTEKGSYFVGNRTACG